MVVTYVEDSDDRTDNEWVIAPTIEMCHNILADLGWFEKHDVYYESSFETTSAAEARAFAESERMRT